VHLAGFLAADERFLRRDNAGFLPEMAFLAPPPSLFIAQTVVSQVGCRPEQPATQIAFIPGWLAVELQKDFLGQILGCRPFPQEIIEPPVHQGVVALKQDFEFSRFYSPSLPDHPCYNYNTAGEDFVTGNFFSQNLMIFYSTSINKIGYPEAGPGKKKKECKTYRLSKERGHARLDSRDYTLINARKTTIPLRVLFAKKSFQKAIK
jgi:hypothetical protein